MSERTLWRHPDFMKLWAADSVSQLGSQITLLALPLLAITVLKATTFEVGLLSAVEMAPFLLVGLPAGAIVDRLRRRPVLIAGDIGRAAALASIPIAHAFGALHLAQLYVVAFVTGVLTVFFDVAYQSYLPALVERDQLADGNTKLEISRSGGQIAGPGLAGVLISAFGAATVVAADAASFVVSAMGIGAIRRAEPPVPPPGGSARGRLRRDVAEGLRYVLRHPLLRPIAFCTSSSNFFNSMYGAILILFMVRGLHLRPGLVGLVFAFGNAGFLLGALASGWCVRRLKLGPTIVVSAAIGGFGSLLAPLAHVGSALPWLIAAQLVIGVGIPLYNINQVSLRQAICPDRLQGRMNATMRFLVWGTLPLGAVAGGALGRIIGLRPTLWVAAVGGSFAFLFVLLSPVRSLAEVPPQEELREELGDAAPGVGGIVGPVTGAAGIVDEPVVGLGVERDGDVAERT